MSVDRTAAGAVTDSTSATDTAVATDLTRVFAEVYGSPAEGVWSAPGRVNLIGEHTDYNRGRCLPMAIPQRTWVAARRRTDRLVRLRSAQLDGERTISLDDVHPGAELGWAAYVIGVLWAIEQDGAGPLAGLDLVIDGRVPLGAGLSSSAALECATALAVVDLFGLRRYDGPEGLRRLAAACIRAENEIAGAPTGGMDQSIALLAEEGTALLLDFDGDVAPRRVPFDLTGHGLALLVMDTRAEHALDDGQYGNRRQECEDAAAELGVDSLRRIAPTDLDGALERLGSDLLRRRVRHIVTEIERVAETVDALERDDLGALTDLFGASHASMRDDFEISCPELDVAVEAAMATGALASRMTGGGFGGSAIAVVPVERVEEIEQAVRSAFVSHGFAAPDLFAVTAAGRARREPV